MAVYVRTVINGRRSMGRWGLSILSVLVLAVVYSSAAEDHHTTLQLLGFFPCLPTSNSPPPSQLFSDCDLMTLGSVELALEEVNTVLREHNCFQLNLTSKIMDGTPQVSSKRNKCMHYHGKIIAHAAADIGTDMIHI